MIVPVSFFFGTARFPSCAWQTQSLDTASPAGRECCWSAVLGLVPWGAGKIPEDEGRWFARGMGDLLVVRLLVCCLT